jgi:hypothetical protein
MAMPSVLELVESERLLPLQLVPGAPDTPERALMRAVLQRALDDLSGIFAVAMGLRARGRLQRETEEWFLSEDMTWPYSFVNICQVLNLDAGAIRRALLAPQRDAA